MENLPINNGNGQSYGLVLYQTTICSGGQLHANAQDMAQVRLGVSGGGLDTSPLCYWKGQSVAGQLYYLTAF